MKKNTIMIIEDNESVRENLVTLLVEEGFETVSAVNGEAALNLLNLKMPDLIICDVLMPKINGFEFYSLILGNEKTASIPFLFLTAKADKDAIKKAESLGSAKYMTKPFKIDDLLETINGALKTECN